MTPELKIFLATAMGSALFTFVLYALFGGR